MAIVTLKREMSEERLNQLIEAGRYADEHPEILTGDHIEDLTPEDEAILDKIWAEIGPKIREERRKKREERNQAGQS
jgi:hypothetical protein